MNKFLQTDLATNGLETLVKDVLSQQRSLKQAFLPDQSEVLGTNNPYSSLMSNLDAKSDSIAMAFKVCLKPLLIALNWSGEPRHLIEALPHTEPLSDICQFAAVMMTLGFDVKLFNDSLLKLQPSQLPCISIMPNGHPCIVLEINPNGMANVLNGKKNKIEELELSKSSCYFCLFSKKVESDEKSHKKYSWFYEAILNFKQQFLAVGLLTFLINILGLATPLYIMTVYDKVFTAAAGDTLAFLAIGIFLIMGFEFYLRTMRGKLVANVGARFNAALLAASFGKILGFQISMTESASIGSQLMRIKQFQSISNFFSGRVVNAVLDFPFIIVFFLVIGAIGGALAWVPVCLAISYLLIGIITMPITQRNLVQSGRARSAWQNFLLETMEMSGTVKQLGAEEIWQKRCEEHYSELTSLKFKSQFLDGVLNSVSQGLVLISGIATLWMGTLLVLSNEITTGTLIAIMMLVWKVLSPVQTIFLSFSNISQLSESVQQVNQLMRLSSENRIDNSSGIFRTFSGDIRLKNVGFRYNQKSEPVAKNVSIRILPNEITALTGSNSSGKSTLLKFIIGLYLPQAGSVFVDGLNIKQINMGELRASITYVPQDPVFFYGTVAQNIRLFQPTATDDDIEKALSDAGIDIERNSTFPDGLQTRLTGKFLKDIPEGLRQRLSLARAYAKKSKIYLFDEPFALLDNRGREVFTNKLRQLKKSATVVIATNNTDQLSMCDQIVYLNQGCVVSSGPPGKILPML